MDRVELIVKIIFMILRKGLDYCHITKPHIHIIYNTKSKAKITEKREKLN